MSSGEFKGEENPGHQTIKDLFDRGLDVLGAGSCSMKVKLLIGALRRLSNVEPGDANLITRPILYSEVGEDKPTIPQEQQLHGFADISPVEKLAVTHLDTTPGDHRIAIYYVYNNNRENLVIKLWDIREQTNLTDFPSVTEEDRCASALYLPHLYHTEQLEYSITLTSNTENETASFEDDLYSTTQAGNTRGDILDDLTTAVNSGVVSDRLLNYLHLEKLQKIYFPNGLNIGQISVRIPSIESVPDPCSLKLDQIINSVFGVRDRGWMIETSNSDQYIRVEPSPEPDARHLDVYTVRNDIGSQAVENLVGRIDYSDQSSPPTSDLPEEITQDLCEQLDVKEVHVVDQEFGDELANWIRKNENLPSNELLKKLSDKIIQLTVSYRKDNEIESRVVLDIGELDIRSIGPGELFSNLSNRLNPLKVTVLANHDQLVFANCKEAVLYECGVTGAKEAFTVLGYNKNQDNNYKKTDFLRGQKLWAQNCKIAFQDIGDGPSQDRNNNSGVTLVDCLADKCNEAFINCRSMEGCYSHGANRAFVSNVPTIVEDHRECYIYSGAPERLIDCVAESCQQAFVFRVKEGRAYRKMARNHSTHLKLRGFFGSERMSGCQSIDCDISFAVSRLVQFAKPEEIHNLSRQFTTSKSKGARIIKSRRAKTANGELLILVDGIPNNIMT